VLFGGYDGAYSGQTWEWNGSAWTLRSSSGPSPRAGHALAFDSGRGVTVLFGGYTTAGASGQTWEWNGSSWTLRSSSGPAPRFDTAIAYDAGRGVTVLFGGSAGANQTWEWNGTSWTQRLGVMPPGRNGHAMAYDAARQAVVLFGGYTTGYAEDLWEWNGVLWTLAAAGGPGGRVGHALAYDAGRGAAVLFGGGSATGSDSQTWEWSNAGSPITITQQPVNRTACEGGGVTFAVTALGTPPLAYQWRRNGVNIAGATGSALGLNAVDSGDAGGYSVAVSSACGTLISATATLTVMLGGDSNCDGVLNLFDIDPFVLAVLAGQGAWSSTYDCDFECANDIDDNGQVTFFDVDPFIDLIFGG
jgi:hypothetical protein